MNLPEFTKLTNIATVRLENMRHRPTWLLAECVRRVVHAVTDSDVIIS